LAFKVIQGYCSAWQSTVAAPRGGYGPPIWGLAPPIWVSQHEAKCSLCKLQ